MNEKQKVGEFYTKLSEETIAGIIRNRIRDAKKEIKEEIKEKLREHFYHSSAGVREKVESFIGIELEKEE